jgi:hypothetical protein
VVFLKFVEEVQTMAAAEVELNPPVSPFSKGDSLPLILLKNPIAEALFMLIDVERRMIFHCGSSLQ